MFGSDSNTVSGASSKSEKFFSLLMQVFLYGIVFLAGFIFAKIQTLISGL